MSTIAFVDFLVNTITFTLVYAISETLAGYYRAWIALRWGDDTPRQEGFLTLDILAHINPLGLAFLLLFGLGWGRYIPLSIHKIKGPFVRVKRWFVFYSNSVAFLVLALIAQIIATINVPQPVVGTLCGLIGRYSGNCADASQYMFSQLYGSGGSIYVKTIYYFLVSFALVNTMRAAISFITNSTLLIAASVVDPMRVTLRERLFVWGLSLAMLFIALPWVRDGVTLFLNIVVMLLMPVLRSVGG